MRNLLIFGTTMVLMHCALHAQDSSRIVINTININDYTIELVKVQQIDEVAVKRLNYQAPYSWLYQIYEKDSFIIAVQYFKDSCELYFDSRIKKQGFYYTTHGVKINICDKTVTQIMPPDVSWIKDTFDSITIYPLDSVLDPYDYQGQRTVISNYSEREPEHLNLQHQKDVEFMYRDPSFIGMYQKGSELRLHSALTYYKSGNAQTIYLYYDKFMYEGWFYNVGYSEHGTYNVAKMVWDKHEAAK